MNLWIQRQYQTTKQQKIKTKPVNDLNSYKCPRYNFTQGLLVTRIDQGSVICPFNANVIHLQGSIIRVRTPELQTPTFELLFETLRNKYNERSEDSKNLSIF